MSQDWVGLIMPMVETEEGPLKMADEVPDFVRQIMEEARRALDRVQVGDRGPGFWFEQIEADKDAWAVMRSLGWNLHQISAILEKVKDKPLPQEVIESFLNAGMILYALGYVLAESQVLARQPYNPPEGVQA